YQGDKFEVWDVSYSSNLGGYNFEYKPNDSDYTYKGSYFPKQDRLAANGYMWDRVSKQWRDIFDPYVKKIGGNYLIIGGLGSGSPGSGLESKEQKEKYYDQVDASLGYMFDTGSTKEWIAKKHNYIRGNLSVFIEAPRTAEDIYKILQMAEKINTKLRSFGLYSYKLEVITYDLPEGFNIDNYFEEVKSDFTTSIDWWFVEGIQKYAWGYLYLASCTKINDFEKACNTQYGVENIKTRKKIVTGNTTADRISSLNDIAKEFRLVDKFGVPNKCSNLGCSGIWHARSRAHTPLKDSKYYTTLEKLISKGE
ncbi:hypothetical protein IB644_00545, partial [Allofrancisella guangzhouensis]